MNWLPMILLCTLLVGCKTTDRCGSPSAFAPAGDQWIQTELFFGLSKPDGSLISTNHWKNFLDGQILTRFPKGLTVLEAEGRYLDNQHRTISEPSRIVILFYPSAEAAPAGSNITAIATSYCTQFSQESVLRSDSVKRTSFLSK